MDRLKPILVTEPEILFCDPDILVINKPAGLACHPGPRTRESVEGLLAGLQMGKRRPPVLMHRLDRDTSGCLLLARSRIGRQDIQAAFQTRKIRKEYWALVFGMPFSEGAQGVLHIRMKKVSTHAGGWRMVVADDGEEAITRYRNLGGDKASAWISLEPVTGRTHQLRVQMAHLGHPIVGDRLYARGSAGGPDLMLCARRIRLPWKGGTLDVCAPPPAHMRVRLAASGWREDEPQHQPLPGQNG